MGFMPSGSYFETGAFGVDSRWGLVMKTLDVSFLSFHILVRSCVT
jgi:hypothetical protein